MEEKRKIFKKLEDGTIDTSTATATATGKIHKYLYTILFLLLFAECRDSQVNSESKVTTSYSEGQVMSESKVTVPSKAGM